VKSFVKANQGNQTDSQIEGDLAMAAIDRLLVHQASAPEVMRAADRAAESLGWRVKKREPSALAFKNVGRTWRQDTIRVSAKVIDTDEGPAVMASASSWGFLWARRPYLEEALDEFYAAIRACLNGHAAVNRTAPHLGAFALARGLVLLVAEASGFALQYFVFSDYGPSRAWPEKVLVSLFLAVCATVAWVGIDVLGRSRARPFLLLSLGAALVAGAGALFAVGQSATGQNVLVMLVGLAVFGVGLSTLERGRNPAGGRQVS
jgi:hypothetical protein